MDFQKTVGSNWLGRTERVLQFGELLGKKAPAASIYSVY